MNLKDITLSAISIAKRINAAGRGTEESSNSQKTENRAAVFWRRGRVVEVSSGDQASTRKDERILSWMAVLIQVGILNATDLCT